MIKVSATNTIDLVVVPEMVAPSVFSERLLSVKSCCNYLISGCFPVNHRTGANPRYPLLKEIKAMYLKAYYGEKA